MNTQVLIVTALKLEFNAVKRFLSEIKDVIHPDTGSQYSVGKFKSINVALIETGPGNSKAAHETDRAILFFKPEYVFFVGIAGGIKDVALSDLVVGSKVIGYEIGKEGESFKPRHDSIPSSYKLEQLAKKISRSNTNSYNIFVAPIAAGEKVIASTKTKIFEHIVKYCSEALAVEMEGIGFMEATRAYPLDAIVVRGISDLLNKKEESDAKGFQDIAAENAAKFSFEMIDGIFLMELPNLQDADFRKSLVDKLTILYPKGPETDDIWKRAGGDISILSNDQSRKSQWYNAIERLSKGGGGKTITLKSLEEEVRVDFPKSKLY